MAWAEVALDGLSEAVVALDPVRDESGAIVDFVYVWANASACTYNGMSREETLGRRFLDLFPGAREHGLFAQYLDVMDTGRSLVLSDLVYDNELRGKEPLRYDLRAARAEGGLVISWHDVTDRYITQRDLQHSASTDYLTHLTSREEGVALLRRALAADPGEFRLGVAYLDIDGLKAVNDRYGHAAGDALLITTALRVRAAVRADDAVIRLGGDELVVVLHGVGTIEAAFTVCEKIRESVSASISVNDDRISTSVSIGLTMADPGDSVGSILERADTAMYRAKRAGGNRIIAAPTTA